MWDGIRRRHAGDLAGREAAERALVALLHKTFSAFDSEVARRPAVYKVDRFKNINSDHFVKTKFKAKQDKIG